MSPTRRQASISDLGEFQLIQSLPQRFTTQGFQAAVEIGDDAAVIPSSSSQPLVLSTDCLVEGIHFSRKTATCFDIGYKTASVNLSDMAAMGALPTAILVAIALPGSFTTQDWKGFYRGLAVPCKPYNIKLLGGDTSSSLTSLFITVTIIGHVNGKRYLTRKGAKTGDLIYVSGTLGDSQAGLTYLKRNLSLPRRSKLSTPIKYLLKRHLQPVAQVSLGRLLVSKPYASAALDLSDGLSGDLMHLCKHSQVGALIHMNQLPMSRHMQWYAKRIHISPFSWSLHGGEDYELLFTVPPSQHQAVEKLARRHRIQITQIGMIQPRRHGIRIVHHDGTTHPLPQNSFEHFSS